MKVIFLTQPQQFNPRALGYSLAQNILGNGIKESFSKHVTNRLNLPIKVRITHLPGDQRFPGGKILKAGYGYISNHYAPQDNKSLDCYVSHQLLLETDKNSANYPIFMVHQIIPESGDLDEYKIMLGFDDIDTAKEAYLNCAPSFRFGKIEKITPAFLSTFQRPVSLAETKAKKCVVGYPCSRACISTNKNCRNKLNPGGESYNFAKWVTTHLSLGGNLTKQQLSKADETTGGSLSKLLATKDMPLPKAEAKKEEPKDSKRETYPNGYLKPTQGDNVYTLSQNMLGIPVRIKGTVLKINPGGDTMQVQILTSGVNVGKTGKKTVNRDAWRVENDPNEKIVKEKIEKTKAEKQAKEDEQKKQNEDKAIELAKEAYNKGIAAGEIPLESFNGLRKGDKINEYLPSLYDGGQPLKFNYEYVKKSDKDGFHIIKETDEDGTSERVIKEGGYNDKSLFTKAAPLSKPETKKQEPAPQAQPPQEIKPPTTKEVIDILPKLFKSNLPIESHNLAVKTRDNFVKSYFDDSFKDSPENKAKMVEILTDKAPYATYNLSRTWSDIGEQYLPSETHKLAYNLLYYRKLIEETPALVDKSIKQQEAERQAKLERQETAKEAERQANLLKPKPQILDTIDINLNKFNKSGYKEQPINIATKDGDINIPAMVKGDVAVHLTLSNNKSLKDSYTVTHIPTGLIIHTFSPDNRPRKKSATQNAKLAKQLADGLQDIDLKGKDLSKESVSKAGELVKSIVLGA